MHKKLALTPPMGWNSWDCYGAAVNEEQLLANADNAVDSAHATLCPLPFQSSMVEDCIGRGKSMQEGGAIYNFTGPQGFGIANNTDGLIAIKKLVFEEKRFTLAELGEALKANFGYGVHGAAAYPETGRDWPGLVVVAAGRGGDDVLPFCQQYVHHVR